MQMRRESFRALERLRCQCIQHTISFLERLCNTSHEYHDLPTTGTDGAGALHRSEFCGKLSRRVPRCRRLVLALVFPLGLGIINSTFTDSSMCLSLNHVYVGGHKTDELPVPKIHRDCGTIGPGRRYLLPADVDRDGAQRVARGRATGEN